MLVELHVRNFALVENKSIQLGTGMTAFTGETGAGKSLLLNAITLLLGAKAQKDMVRDGFETALVEGIFDLSQDSSRIQWLYDNGFESQEEDSSLLVVKREISVSLNSKSRIWIQGLAATRHQLQELLGDWIEISGQHEFLRLNKESYLLEILDQYAGHTKLKQKYASLYTEWKSLQKTLQELRGKGGDKANLVELKRFQLEELEKANIHQSLPTEFEQLQVDLKKSRTQDERIGALHKAILYIENESSNMESSLGALESLRLSVNEIREFQDQDEQILQAVKLLDEALSLLMDAKAHLENATTSADLDPQALDHIESRISSINSLKRKFRCDVEDLFKIKTALQIELSDLENLDSRVGELQKQIDSSYKEIQRLAEELHSNRQTAAAKLIKQWQTGVRELGMTKASFELQLTTAEDYSVNGNSRLVLLFAANPGSKARPIGQVASGGELSRILLALKHIVSPKGEVCAYLFDEIDTGIGGETAQTVGQRLRDIARTSQVIVVTHLPQVAAMATDHFQIYKNTENSKTKTEINHLSKKDREIEIARMLGSSKSKAATSLAKEMLENLSL